MYLVKKPRAIRRSADCISLQPLNSAKASNVHFLLSLLLAGVVQLSLSYQASQRRMSRLSKAAGTNPLQTELTAFKHDPASYHESAVIGIFTDSHTGDAATAFVSVLLLWTAGEWSAAGGGPPGGAAPGIPPGWGAGGGPAEVNKCQFNCCLVCKRA